MGKIFKRVLLGVAALALAGCGGGGGGGASQAVAAASTADAELAALRGELNPYPEYSVILHGLRDAGATPEHQYKVVWHDPKAADDSLRVRVRYTDWSPITRSLYQQEQPLQGMAVLSRRDGGPVSTQAMPPVYAYVGDPQYGSWQTVDGTPAWVFAAQYALMAEALDELGDLAEHKYKKNKSSRTPVVVVSRSGYDSYRSSPATYTATYRQKYTQHAAANPAPAGTFAAKVRSRSESAAQPGFVARAQEREQASASRFDSKVQGRMNGTPNAATPATPSSSASSRTATTPSRTATTPSRSSGSGWYTPRSSSSSSRATTRSSGGSWGGSSSRRSGRRRP